LFSIAFTGVVLAVWESRKLKPAFVYEPSHSEALKVK